ncbi:MAG: hypothetical protein ABIQ31_12955 [Ferruginibacter sp.]
MIFSDPLPGTDALATQQSCDANNAGKSHWSGLVQEVRLVQTAILAAGILSREATPAIKHTGSKKVSSKKIMK